MSSFQTVVVGTDGSDSSLRAVDRAGKLAAGMGAKLIVATAYIPVSEGARTASARKGADYHTSGDARVYAILRDAAARAEAAGATKIEERAGSVPANVSRRAKADVLIAHTTS